MSNKRVAVAMSGGVDSSVAAALLKDRGFHISGVTMKIWDGEELPGVQTRHSCYGPGESEDIKDTQKVAEKLGIDLHIIDLSEEYRKEVLDYFEQEYLSGRTPNPCLMCNRRIKFQALIDKAADAGVEYDFFATGHYSSIEYNNISGRYLLKKASDKLKDQSYFLAFLSQYQLGQTLFPIGEYTKQEVRELARKYELDIAEKQESQDFIDAGYRSLIGDAPAGLIKNMNGEILGEHTGIANYTIGQRKGLGISGKDPFYVTDINPTTNVITVGSREDIYSDELTARNMNWIGMEKPKTVMEVRAKIRYSHDEAEATITPVDDIRIKVKFKESQMAITPGQAVVFYRDDIVLGGGTIERSRGK
ncbi:MAG: tRNA 2-thiouridine(34) synthase MnmA [Dehalococcoidales bacterium]|nr:MAG: tRNA 2-thiouridine(34) synthase MnmA [Dehalococcoidales bacterium]